VLKAKGGQLVSHADYGIHNAKKVKYQKKVIQELEEHRYANFRIRSFNECTYWILLN
jgi:hypothetical protein